jgi:exopolyphosphatase/guanosine-5'-triphosphate,3'-diphosphate pyrophosphatase
VGIGADPVATALKPLDGSAPSRIGASVDLGSNSVHLLVAGIDGHRLQPIADESLFLGLGAAIAERGYLGRDARRELIGALARYADVARGHGSTSVTFIGTEPLRRAADAHAIVLQAVMAAGAPLHVVSHEEEAFLTILGVSEGRPVAHETLVVDIGGGSSEFCVVDPVHRPRAAGLRLGSGRLTDRFVSHDPPTPEEVRAMRAAALEIVLGAPVAAPEEVVAVGGTASNLLKVLPGAAIDRNVTRARLGEAFRILGTEPAAMASERHGINPIRARILPAGAAILDAILERYGTDRVRVSEAGVREGTIQVVAHAGPGWRDRLPNLAHGWRS